MYESSNVLQIQTQTDLTHLSCQPEREVFYKSPGCFLYIYKECNKQQLYK